MEVLSPQQIINKAISLYKPVAIYAGFSGGRDSIATVHWMMNNVPGTEVVHFNTGIGIERSRVFVRETCASYGWKLHEIRAKEDCGQDYEELVKRFGFPGPDGHGMMYARLKERAVRLLVKRSKKNRNDKVLIATGIRHDESLRRMQYATREVNTVGAQVWANPIYWWTKEQRDAYIAEHNLPVNLIAEQLGMSGECLCGAYAHKGEKELVRKVCPSTASELDRIEQVALSAGFTWSWEGRPPAGGHNPRQMQMFMPLCVGCEKSAIVQAELAGVNE